MSWNESSAFYGFLVLNTKANTAAISAIYMHVEVIFLTFEQFRWLIIFRLILSVAYRNLAIREWRISINIYSLLFRFRN